MHVCSGAYRTDSYQQSASTGCSLQVWAWFPLPGKAAASLLQLVSDQPAHLIFTQAQEAIDTCLFATFLCMQSSFQKCFSSLLLVIGVFFTPYRLVHSSSLSLIRRHSCALLIFFNGISLEVIRVWPVEHNYHWIIFCLHSGCISPSPHLREPKPLCHGFN